ncbi:MAG TPA: ester cyclase [Chryseolinea sp.]|nr:ester cyclase [Chryseolinea sp.]
MFSAKRYFQFIIPGMVVLTLMSCNRSSDLQERNKALIIKANDELIGKGNVSYADEIIDAGYTIPGFSEKGPVLIKTFVADLKKAFPDLEYTVDHVIAEGNMVSWRRTHKGTQQGDFMGYKATGKTVNWQEFIVARITDDGKIGEEWAASDFDVNAQRASGVDGEYVNLPPLTGQTSLHNGQFVFSVGPSNGSSPLTGQAGTYIIDGDNITHTYRFSTNPKDIGTSFSWKVKSWCADTVSFTLFNNKGEQTGEGRAVRVSY